MHINCPNCRNGVELGEEPPKADVSCPICGSQFHFSGEQHDETLPVDPDKTLADDPTKTLPNSLFASANIGRFELINEVGTGSFGSVWRGRDPKLDRTVAIKIPRKGKLPQKNVQRFFREARVAAQLKHPNIVPIYDVGMNDETIYIVSEFVEGVSLGDRLGGDYFDLKHCAALCAKVARALHHAHEKGVIHRDLKPSNILLDDRGEPHVTDFGLAKREEGEITLTTKAGIFGTPAYMSPEQARGDAHFVDRTTDVIRLA